MRRIETKYLMREDIVPFLSELILQQLQSEFSEVRTRSYLVHSLYYDTFDRQCYFSKLEGEHQRFKLRLRHYGESARYLEWKIKTGEQGTKIRYQIDPEKVDQLILDLWPHERLRPTNTFLLPTIEVQYTRTEFATNDPRLRLTIDRDTSYRSPGSKGFWLPTYSAGQAILEIKTSTSSTADFRALEIPKMLKLRRMSLSKYCDSLREGRLV